MKVSICTNRNVITPCGLENFDYQLDTYIGCEHYCNYCYVLSKAETNWLDEIQIHNNIIDQLSEELNTITPQTIYIGYNSDPYQPCEFDLLQTRNVLKLLCSRNFSASILTKSDLVVRDIDLLKKMEDANVSISFAFTDNHARQLFEINTITTEKRIATLRELSNNGVKTSAIICPIIPYITDAHKLIEMISPYAEKIWIYGLSINDKSDQNWANMLSILETNYPEMLDSIVAAIFDRDDLYWKYLSNELNVLKDEKQLNLNIHL